MISGACLGVRGVYEFVKANQALYNAGPQAVVQFLAQVGIFWCVLLHVLLLQASATVRRKTSNKPGVAMSTRCFCHALLNVGALTSMHARFRTPFISEDFQGLKYFRIKTEHLNKKLFVERNPNFIAKSFICG